MENVPTLTENNNLFESICLSWQNCTHPPPLDAPPCHIEVFSCCVPPSSFSIRSIQGHWCMLVENRLETQSQHLTETWRHSVFQHRAVRGENNTQKVGALSPQWNTVQYALDFCVQKFVLKRKMPTCTHTHTPLCVCVRACFLSVFPLTTWWIQPDSPADVESFKSRALALS